MRIENAIASIDHYADRWARLEEVRRIPGGVLLSFGIHKGRRGQLIEAWKIRCAQVHMAKITAWDGGGLAVYSSNHPAAREFSARQAEVRWSGTSDKSSLIGALYKEHANAVDDWIPFDSYSSVRDISKGRFSFKGPEFLMRAYAKALRAIGEHPQLILRRKKRAVSPRVLHFGDSYVVANSFVAERFAKPNGASGNSAIS
jgi:hypothetical protein